MERQGLLIVTSTTILTAVLNAPKKQERIRRMNNEHVFMERFWRIDSENNSWYAKMPVEILKRTLLSNYYLGINSLSLSLSVLVYSRFKDDKTRFFFYYKYQISFFHAHTFLG